MASIGGSEMEEVRPQRFSPTVEHQIAALYEAQKYGDAGLDFVIKVFKDLVAQDKRGELKQVMWAAYDLLCSRTESQIKQVLWDYNPYQLFECLNTFTGHGYYECGQSTIAISPNGQILATSNRNSELIKIWQLHTGQEIRTIIGHTKGTYSLAFSSEGQTLWGGSYCEHGRDEYDNWFEIKEWNLETGEVIHCLPGYGDFALSPDGQLLVTGSWDKIEVWNLQTEQKIRTLQGDCCVDSIAFSTDGKTIISTDLLVGYKRSTERLKVWDLDTGQLVRTLGEKTEYCKAFILNPNGQTLISTTDKESLKIWDLSTGELLRTVMTSLSPLALSLDGYTLILDDRILVNGYIFGGISSTINVWDLRTWKEIPTFMKHPDVTSIALSRDGQNIISSNYNRTIKVWGVP
jgi:WD40 repeat protein